MIANLWSIALNEANANGCRTTPRRARGQKAHGAKGRRRDQNPHRPHPRARRGKFQRVLRADLHPRLGEELRDAAQARRAADHGRSGRRVEGHGKIQRAAAAGRGIRQADRPCDVLAFKGESEGRAGRWRNFDCGFDPRAGHLHYAAQQSQRSSHQSATRSLSTREFRRHAAVAEEVIQFVAADASPL